MLELSLNTAQSRAWLYGGYRCSVVASLRDPDAAIPVAQLFHNLLQAAPNASLILEHAEVRDVDGETIYLLKNTRGRSEGTRGAGQGGEELFHASGVLRTSNGNSEKNGKSEKDKRNDTIPFSFDVRSAFNSFAGQVIEHRLQSTLSPALRPVLGAFEFQHLPQLVPAEVQQIRFGIEHFKALFGGALSSFVGPTAYQRFYLEMSVEEIRLHIGQDFAAVRGELPRFEGNLIGPLDYALDHLELFVGLQGKLRTALAS